ncbi:MAG: hypothetical protein N3F66_04585 [Spirochaetes bacterium]|nr:hypothetical protein [Spirochaetota bacterium]
MVITSEQLKRLGLFIILLIILLLYNVYSKLHFNWYGIDIIVRSYSFLFSFLCIFNYTQLDFKSYKLLYANRFPKYAHIIIFFESRIIPFLIIYIIAALHTLIDNINNSNWPYTAYVGILDGRYTNIIFYSLILFAVLRYKVKPLIAIPLFIGGSIAFYIVDKLIYTNLIAGTGIVITKLIKLSILSGVLVFEFFQLNIFQIIVISLLTSSIIFSGTIGTYLFLYSFTKQESIKKEILFKLLRYGIPLNINYLKQYVLETRNYKDYQLFMVYSTELNIPVHFTDKQWETLLFSENIEMADEVASVLLTKSITVSFDSIIDYASNMSSNQNEKLQSAAYLARLAARFADGNEKKIINRFEQGNLSLQIWLMSVMGYHKKIIYLPVLLPYCANRNTTLATTAYSTLVQITGKNPSVELNLPTNDPRVLNAFKDFYFHTGNIK